MSLKGTAETLLGNSASKQLNLPIPRSPRGGKPAFAGHVGKGAELVFKTIPLFSSEACPEPVEGLGLNGDSSKFDCFEPMVKSCSQGEKSRGGHSHRPPSLDCSRDERFFLSPKSTVNGLEPLPKKEVAHGR